MYSYEFSLFKKEQFLEHVMPAWEKIQAKKTNLNYFQTHQWNNAIVKHLLPERKIYFVIAYYSEMPIAIFPLEHTFITDYRYFKIPILQFPSHDHIPLSDIISTENDFHYFFSNMFEFLRNEIELNFHILKFDNVQKQSDLMKIIDCKDETISIQSKINKSSFLNIFDTFEKTTRHISGKFLRNIHRQLRKSEKHGVVTYKSFCDLGNMETALNTFLDIENDGWKGVSKSSIKCHKDLVAFYKEVIGIVASDINPFVNILYLDNIPIASQIGLRIGNLINLIKIGYSEKHSKLGPGNIILIKTIEHAIENNDTNINFVTAPAWSEKWKSSYSDVFRIYVFNNTLLGKTLHFFMELKRKIIEINTIRGNKNA